MRTSGVTDASADAKRLIDDGLDGPRTATAFHAAAKTTIDLLGLAQHIVSGTDGIADIVVAEDVAGTDDHENAGALDDAGPSILKRAVRCKRKNRDLK